MVDKIIGYDNGHEVWLSDMYPYETFIGYEDYEGNFHAYS